MGCLLVFLCVQASADTSGTCGPNTSWTLDSNRKLTIIGMGMVYNYSISSPAPWGKDIKSLEVKSGVTSLGSYAFYECADLTSVSLPSTLTDINSSAFGWCGNLTSLALSSGLEYIGGWAFHRCSGLTAVTIPASVTEIGECAFLH